MKAKTRFSGLRPKLSGIVIINLLLVFAIMYFFTEGQIDAVTYADKTVELSRRVEDLADIVDERIVAEMDRAKLLSANSIVIERFKKGDYAKLNEYIRGIKESNDTIENIFMMDMKGAFVDSALSLEGVDF